VQRSTPSFREGVCEAALLRWSRERPTEASAPKTEEIPLRRSRGRPCPLPSATPAVRKAEDATGGVRADSGRGQASAASHRGEKTPEGSASRPLVPDPTTHRLPEPALRQPLIHVSGEREAAEGTDDERGVARRKPSSPRAAAGVDDPAVGACGSFRWQKSTSGVWPARAVRDERTEGGRSSHLPRSNEVERGERAPEAVSRWQNLGAVAGSRSRPPSQGSVKAGFGSKSEVERALGDGRRLAASEARVFDEARVEGGAPRRAETLDAGTGAPEDQLPSRSAEDNAARRGRAPRASRSRAHQDRRRPSSPDRRGVGRESEARGAPSSVTRPEPFAGVLGPRRTWRARRKP